MGTYLQSRAQVFLAGLLLAATTGCSKESSPSTAASKPLNVIEEAELDAFGKQLSEAIEHGDDAAIDKLLDYDMLFERLSKFWRFEFRDPKAALAEYRNGFMEKRVYTSVFEMSCKFGATLRVVSCKPSEQCVVMRLLLPGGSPTYVFFQVAHIPAASDDLRVVDFHTFEMGANGLAQLGKSLALFMQYDDDEGHVSDNAPNAEILRQDKSAFFALQQAVMLESHAGAMDYYRMLSKAVRDLEMPMRLALVAAVRLPSKESNPTTREFRIAQAELLLAQFHERFPDEPTSFLDLALAIAGGDEVRALAAIDEINVLVGGDPFLGAYEALAHLRIGDIENASAAAERAQTVADLSGYPLLAAHAVAVARADDAARRQTAEQIVARYSLGFSVLHDSSEGNEFVPPSQARAIVDAVYEDILKWNLE